MGKVKRPDRSKTIKLTTNTFLFAVCLNIDVPDCVLGFASLTQTVSWALTKLWSLVPDLEKSKKWTAHKGSHQVSLTTVTRWLRGHLWAVFWKQELPLQKHLIKNDSTHVSLSFPKGQDQRARVCVFTWYDFRGLNLHKALFREGVSEELAHSRLQAKDGLAGGRLWGGERHYHNTQRDSLGVITQYKTDVWKQDCQFLFMQLFLQGQGHTFKLGTEL